MIMCLVCLRPPVRTLALRAPQFPPPPFPWPVSTLPPPPTKTCSPNAPVGPGEGGPQASASCRLHVLPRARCATAASIRCPTAPPKVCGSARGSPRAAKRCCWARRTIFSNGPFSTDSRALLWGCGGCPQPNPPPRGVTGCWTQHHCVLQCRCSSFVEQHQSSGGSTRGRP